MRKYNNGDLCPMCDKGVLTCKPTDMVINYHGEQWTIPDYPVYYCDHCSEGFVDEETSDKYEKTVRDFHRRVDGLLTSDEIKAVRKKAGMTQEGLAEYLGVIRVSVSRYERGHQTQSMEIDRKLRELGKDAGAMQLKFEYVVAATRDVLAYKQTSTCIMKDCIKPTFGGGKDYALAA